MKTKGLAYSVVLIMALCVLSAEVTWAVPSSDTIIGDNFAPIGSDVNTTTTGTDDVFIGGSAGHSNTSGTGNTFIGFEAGFSNQDGNDNTFIGDEAGLSYSGGGPNTFLGSGAGNSSQSGKDNTFIGFHAGFTNLDGNGNVFLGNLAGSSETGSNKLYIDNCFNSDCTTPLIYGEFDNHTVGFGTITPQFQIEIANDSGNNASLGMRVASSTGGVPIFFGLRAGGSLASPSATPAGKGLFWMGATGHGTTGFSSLLTGLIAFTSSENWTDTATGTDMRIFTTTNGTTARAERVRITNDGKVGIGTTNPTNPLQFGANANNAFISSDGQYHSSSSREYKENIRNLSGEEASIVLAGLNPVKFNFKNDPDKKETAGFIAEDVPDLVAAKDRKSLTTTDIVAVLTKVLQEKSQVIEKQQKALVEQRAINEILMEKLSKLEAEVNRLKSKDMTAKAMNQD